MNNYSLSVPSKTFLLGEYAALQNESALLVNTNPRFEMKFIENEEGYITTVPGWEDDDPLLKYYLENEEALIDFHQEYVDPYNGQGGFGASSAQWVFFYSFLNQYQKSIKFLFEKSVKNEKISDRYRPEDFSFFEKMVLKYRSYSENKFPPSGYDLISQMVGGVCFINFEKKSIIPMNWTFEDLGFFLIKNNQKLDTHFHLKYLEKFDAKSLALCAEKGRDSILNNKPQEFISAVQENFIALKSQNLVAEQSLEKLSVINKISGVLASKGCGALGADVFFVVIDKSKYDSFKVSAKEFNLNIISSHLDVSEGLVASSDFNLPQVELLN